MANKLEEMEFNSVDLCKKGANQRANIKLFKSAQAEGGGEGNEMGLIAKLAKALERVLAAGDEPQAITKADSAGQIRETTRALRKSLESILEDDTLSSVEKHDMMAESLQQFTLEATDLMDGWAQAGGVFKSEDPDDDPDDEEEEPEDEPMDDDPDDDPEDEPENEPDDDEDEPVGKGKSGCKPGIKKTEEKGVFDMATIDISKMSPEDKAVLEALEKKYAPEPDTISLEGLGEMKIHPDVQKAIDEVHELRKSLELKELEGVAKKYEVIGKKAPELAQKLYDLKKAGEQHYNDYVALLDEQVQMADAGIFKEYGTSRGGGPSDLDATVAELRKADPSLTQAQAIVKAYETNPALDPFTGKAK